LARHADLIWENAHDVGATLIQSVHLAQIDIESGYAKALFTEKQRQGKANIAHSDDANANIAGLDTMSKFDGSFKKSWGHLSPQDNNEKMGHRKPINKSAGNKEALLLKPSRKEKADKYQ
jgi:hypothetical protein